MALTKENYEVNKLKLTFWPQKILPPLLFLPLNLLSKVSVTKLVHIEPKDVKFGGGWK